MDVGEGFSAGLECGADLEVAVFGEYGADEVGLDAEGSAGRSAFEKGEAAHDGVEACDEDTSLDGTRDVGEAGLGWEVRCERFAGDPDLELPLELDNHGRGNAFTYGRGYKRL